MSKKMEIFREKDGFSIVFHICRKLGKILKEYFKIKVINKLEIIIKTFRTFSKL